MASSLLLADTYELLNPTINPQYQLSGDSDFGEPVPDTATIPGVLLSGDAVAGTRSGNRTIRLKVAVRAPDRVSLAGYVNDLITVIDAQTTGTFTLTWTPQGGLPVTFDCFRGAWTRERIFTRELQLVTVVTLTCQAYPFGRSNAPVTVAAASPQLQIDSLDATGTPTLVQGPVSQKTEAPGTTVAASFASGVTAGSVLVACVAAYNNAGFSGITGCGATWTQATRSHGSDGTNDIDVEIWIGRFPTAGTTGPVTATAGANPANSISLTIYEIGGLTSTTITAGPTTQGVTLSTVGTHTTLTGPSLAATGGVVIAATANNGGSVSVNAYADTPATWAGEANRNALYVDLTTGVYLPGASVTAQQSFNLTTSSQFKYVSAILQIGGGGGALTGATIDTTNKYEGTGSAAVTLTRQSLTTSRGTSYWYTSPNVSRTISSIDLTPYASIGHRFRWPAPVFATRWTVILTLTVSDGTYSASASVAGTPPPGSTTWYLMTIPISSLSSGAGPGGSPPPMPNLAAITKWTWSLTTVRQTLTSGTALPAYVPAGSSTANIDDIRLFPLSSTAISTGTGAVVTIPAVIGTAPALTALTVTEGGGSMTNLLLHRPPVDQSPDAAILAALSGTPKTATIAAVNNTFRGTYSVVLLLSAAGTGSRTVSVQFDHKQGSTTLASQTVSTSYSTPTGKFAIMRDYVTLPLVPVPDENTTDTLVITVTSSGGTADTFTDVALLDTRGQLVLLGSLPSGTKTVYVDEPDPIAELGQIYASATDRTAATGQLGWGAQTRVGSGPIVLEPGDNRLLAASPDGVVPTITLTYDPRWLDERVL